MRFASCAQLPLWYELWWDNGVFPGQPAADFMWGPLPANLSEVRRKGKGCAGVDDAHAIPVCSRVLAIALTLHACRFSMQRFYVKAWAGFLAFMGLPLAYLYTTTDEFSQPMVSSQCSRCRHWEASQTHMHTCWQLVPVSHRTPFAPVHHFLQRALLPCASTGAYTVPARGA